MAFLDIALPMAARGVRQVPSLNPRDRFPGPKNWPNTAATDINELQVFAGQFPDHNSCSVADDKIGILDIDNYEAAKKLGMPVVKTFAVRTPSGGYHLYYKQTERSRALGNRAIGGVVEFKCRSAAVAAPGSIRDDKPGEYTVRWDHPLADFPDELAAWIESRTAKRTKGSSPVVEDFDFDDFCRHYDIGILGQNGCWQITDACPLAGYRHSGSKATGFYWDGEFLGFRCFSDDCAGKTVGDVIRHLNEDHEPYPENIWPEKEIDLEVDWVENEDAIPVVKEKCIRKNCNCGLEHYDPKPAVAIAEETHTIDELEELLNEKAGIKYPELRFPSEALSGRFKELVERACEGGLGEGLVVPALMTLASAAPAYDIMCGQRICLYTCLLAMVGAGKDVSITHARLTLGMEDKWHKKLFTNYSPSGEKVLAMTIGDHLTKRGSNERTPGPKRHCLISTELESTLNKAKAETSGVLQALQRLWDSNYDTYPDSKNGSVITVDCRLSWLAALPVGKNEIDVELFRQAFGSNTQGGIVSRLTFGFTETRVDSRKLRHWKPPVAKMTSTISEQTMDDDITVTTEELFDHSLLEQLRVFRVEDWRPEVGKQLDEWDAGEDLSGRDTQHIQKAAIISALLNGHKFVEQEDFDFAKSYMTWQSAIRKVFSSGIGKSAQGQFNDTIVEATRRWSRKRIKKNDKNLCEVEGKIFVRWKKLSLDGNWYKYGPDVERTIDALVRGGALAYLVDEEVLVDGVSTKKKENKKWIRVVG